MHLQHIALYVRNLEASIAFYRTVADLEIGRRMLAGPGEIAFMINTEGETEIELVCMPEGRKFEGNGWFLCFSAEELDHRHQQVSEMGLKPSPIQEPGDGTRYFYVYDPDGVSVQLRDFSGRETA
jgi:lactoylglutathione lyase